MQTETSISLVTSGTCLIPAAPRGEAEIAFTCKAGALIDGLIGSHLLEFHEEAFVLRTEGVRVQDRRGGDIGQAAAPPPPADEPPVDREGDLIHLLAGDGHGPDPLCEHCPALHVAPRPAC